MKNILLLLVLVHPSLFAQDTLVTKTGKMLIVSVIDTLGDDVYYMPLQKIHKVELQSLSFKGSSQIQFNNKDTITSNRLAKGNKIFIEASDNGVYVHTLNALESWQFWEVTKDIGTADAILNINVTTHRKAEAHIQMLNPVDRSVLLDVPTSYVLFGDYPNPKKAVVMKNIGERLRPLVSSK